MGPQASEMTTRRDGGHLLSAFFHDAQKISDGITEMAGVQHLETRMSQWAQLRLGELGFFWLLHQPVADGGTRFLRLARKKLFCLRINQHSSAIFVRGHQDGFAIHCLYLVGEEETRHTGQVMVGTDSGDESDVICVARVSGGE